MLTLTQVSKITKSFLFCCEEYSQHITGKVCTIKHSYSIWYFKHRLHNIKKLYVFVRKCTQIKICIDNNSCPFHYNKIWFKTNSWQRPECDLLVQLLQHLPFSLFSSGILYPGSGPHTENNFGNIHVHVHENHTIF